ncbi:hypothetical protein WG907_06485 [Sphingobium sp. AN558]|uniref:hypothetical protein n=1 Tax=Sphingobium sp. AN558 TaxID=3133442 RepID=UPI0030C41FE7
MLTTVKVTDWDRINKPTYWAALSYAFTREVRAYIYHSRSYRPASSTLDAYEIELKFELFDRRLRLNPPLSGMM